MRRANSRWWVWVGFARLVGVAREEDEVHALGDGVVDGVVHRREEVEQARIDAEIVRAVHVWREPVRQCVEVGLGGGASVRFDADVDVGEVEEAHGGMLHPPAAAMRRDGRKSASQKNWHHLASFGTIHSWAPVIRWGCGEAFRGRNEAGLGPR